MSTHNADWFLGVWAAVLAPRTKSGVLDGRALETIVQHLSRSGVAGLVLNGATGEYAAASIDEVQESITVAQKSTNLPFILGTGGAHLQHSLDLARVGKERGACALLAPVPFFFPYAPGDAVAYMEAFSRAVDLPILLYNLPQFTTGYAPEAVAKIRARCEKVVGMKDSSGSLDQLRALKAEGANFRRILGHDGALVTAIGEDLLHGVISGVAGVAPELTLAVWRRQEGAAALLAELLGQLDGVPTPWGLKWIAESRGWMEANFALPLSEARQAEAAAFRQWCASWISRVQEMAPSPGIR